MAITAAGMNAEDKSVPRHCLVDRPVDTLAKRMIAHDDGEDLHKPPIVGIFLDFPDGRLRVLKGHQERTAQPWVDIQPLRCDPAIGRLAEHGGEIWIVRRVRSRNYVQDRCRKIERIKQSLSQGSRILSRFLIARPPIWQGTDRITHQFQAVDAAIVEHLPPIAIQIRGKIGFHGKPWMHVAIYRSQPCDHGLPATLLNTQHSDLLLDVSEEPDAPLLRCTWLRDPFPGL